MYASQVCAVIAHGSLGPHEDTGALTSDHVRCSNRLRRHSAHNRKLTEHGGSASTRDTLLVKLSEIILACKLPLLVASYGCSTDTHAEPTVDPSRPPRALHDHGGDSAASVSALRLGLQAEGACLGLDEGAACTVSLGGAPVHGTCAPDASRSATHICVPKDAITASELETYLDNLESQIRSTRGEQRIN